MKRSTRTQILRSIGPVVITFVITVMIHNSAFSAVPADPVGPGAGPVGPGAGPVGPGAGPAGPGAGPAGPGAGPVGPGAGPVGPGAGPVGPVGPVSNQSMVSGRVFEEDGSGVPSVSVTVFKNNGPSILQTALIKIITELDGSFKISLPRGEKVTFIFEDDDFATQVIPVTAPSIEGGLVNIDVMIIARGAPQTVDGATGGTITGKDGASITISPNSIVDQAGNLVTGNIDVVITPNDISTPNGTNTFPGRYSGFPAGSTTESEIVSYGAFEAKLTLEDTDEEVFLADGYAVDIQIPLYKKQKLTEDGGGDYAAGDNIALWSLEETTGRWIQKGEGMVATSVNSPTGLVLQGQANQFGWWNIDVDFTPALATITVTGMDGTAQIKARNTGDIGAWGSRNRTFLINAGATTTAPLKVPSDGETCYWAEITFLDGTEGITAEQCPIPSMPGDMFSLILGLSTAANLEITASPALTGPPIEGTVNDPIQIIQLRPLTKESDVDYEISSGKLPDGMTLTQITTLALGSLDSTKAIIAGVPIKSGTFTVIIKGTDTTSGDMDFITLNYLIL